MKRAPVVRITEVERPERWVVDAMLAPLASYSRSKGFAYHPHDLTLVLEADGEILGGLVAETAWSWMYVKLLAVDEGARGLGHGRRLVERAEQIARGRGCVGVWVDTFTFQSPGFYEKLGYEEFGRLPDNPPGHARVFFRKTLA